MGSRGPRQREDSSAADLAPGWRVCRFVMGQPRPAASSVPRLDLDSFDSAAAQRGRYLLSGPRLGVKPVELLIKSLNEVVAGRNDAPFEAVRVMHESYEKERTRLLQMCRKERERIIQADGDTWPGAHGGSGPEVAPVAKLKDPSAQRQPLPYADLCLKGIPVSSKRDPDRSTVCSFSLGDLRHSPATEMKLERLTKDIRKEMCVTVSERDRKIAALMLVKHQEEQARLKLHQQEVEEREEARRQENAQRAQAERKRRKELRQRVQRWREELEARRRMREQQEEERAGQLEQEVLLQEDRWRRLKEEVEVQRREKMEAAQREAEGRKRYQEKLLRERQEVERRERERESQVAVERQQRARRSKVLQEKKERQRLQEENHRELLRHLLLKQQAERQVEEEEAQTRSGLQRKLQQSHLKRAQAAGARLAELQERAAREEEQTRRARLRAQLQSARQLTHKQVLVQLSQRRTERAAQHAAAQHRDRAQRARQRNQHRRLRHQRLREGVQREEEAVRRVRESYISMKEWRRERLRRQREQIQAEAQTLARASFHMRERVRQQTRSRTFDRMALEAQLTASMSHMTL